MYLTLLQESAAATAYAHTFFVFTAHVHNNTGNRQIKQQNRARNFKIYTFRV